MRVTRLLLLVLACGLLTAASCSDPPPRPDAAGISGSLGRNDLLGPVLGSLGLLSCSPLPADSVTQIVGPGGGTIVVGPHVLTIPEDALEADVAITAVMPSDTVNVVRFEPHGLAFEKPARLTMSYANCNLLNQLLPKRIAYTSNGLDILEYLQSIDFLLSQKVRGTLQHFSGYAVAW